MDDAVINCSSCNSKVLTHRDGRAMSSDRKDASQAEESSSVFRILVACACGLLLLTPLTLIITGSPPAAAEQSQPFWHAPLQAVRAGLQQHSPGLASWAATGVRTKPRPVLHPGGEYAVAVHDDSVSSIPVQAFSSARSSAGMAKAYEAVSAPVSDFSGRAVAALAVLPDQVKQQLASRSLAFPARASASARQWQYKMADYFLHWSRQIGIAATWIGQQGAKGAAYTQQSARSTAAAVSACRAHIELHAVHAGRIC